MDKTVVELFAGVGGFRVGLNNITGFDDSGRAIENGDFTFVWSNQWEPSTKVQHAFNCYHTRFGGDSDCNMDISKVVKSEIPDHTLLCGGFPCQDYSVAHSLTKEKGIEGKKGVLWWQIRDILQEKKPPFVLLENVDRLLKSPSKQRGRDFGIMLRCFSDLGYRVEWRVINAAEYGFPQRRRRIFIFAYHKDTKYAIQQDSVSSELNILDKGLLAQALPLDGAIGKFKKTDLGKYSDVVEISDKYHFLFENSGYMRDGKVVTIKGTVDEPEYMPLSKIILDEVQERYFISDKKKAQFATLRAAKKIPRIRPNGEPYLYSEGAMSEYDDLSLPGRTMLTSEGSVNRSTHIIKDKKTGNLRTLTPIECERLNMFPDDWTNTGMTDRRRQFMMGNALVTGIVSRIGTHLSEIISKE